MRNELNLAPPNGEKGMFSLYYHVANALLRRQSTVKEFTEEAVRDPRVLDMCKKVHLEITNLIIPTKNDGISVIREICRWIKRELGADTPIHFARFYPLYKLTGLPPTPVVTLERARSTALAEGLEYVYISNIPGHEGENTFCPKCRKMIIRRAGYMVVEINVTQGKCKYCGKPIPGIWS